MKTIINLMKRLTLCLTILLLLPALAAYACNNDCQCGLGGKCFYLPNIVDGFCVNTPLKTHHVHEDYHHLCVVIDETRNVSLKDLAKLRKLELKTQLVIHSRESYKQLTHRRCACPYDSTSIGSVCGVHSAYIRNAGTSPLCYEYDVKERHINEFKNIGIRF